MNAQEFHRLTNAQARSGQSIAAFCREKGIAAPTFHYWRRRFGTSPVASASGFVEVQVRNRPAFPPCASPCSITLTFHGATLTLTEGFSPASLSACLLALQEVAAC